jgi:hypothetical protein
MLCSFLARLGSRAHHNGAARTRRKTVVFVVAACLGACDQESEPPELSVRTDQLSVVGTYADYTMAPGSKAQQMSATYTITENPSGPAAAYFLSTFFYFTDAAGNTPTFTNTNGSQDAVAGYIGLQPYASVRNGSALVFSVFGPTSSGTYADGTPCEEGADGGIGRSCILARELAANAPYVMKVQHTGNGVFNGYVNGTLFATITVPSARAVGNFVNQFMEPYLGASDCHTAAYFKATLGVPVFSPAISLQKSMHAAVGHCANSTVTAAPDGLSHSFEIGTPAPALGISLLAKANGSFVAAASTAQGCGGGALVASSASFGTCASLFEIDRGGGNVTLQTENGLRIRCTSTGSVLADQTSPSATWLKSVGSDGLVTYASGTRYLGVTGTSVNCSGTSVTDARRFVRTSATYRIRNAWLGGYLLETGAGRVAYGADTPHSIAALWTLEPFGYHQVRIKSLKSGLHLNNEGDPVDASGNFVAVTSAVGDGWNSAAWTRQPAGDSTYRLQNLWQPTKFLHVEQQLGYPTLGPAGAGWVSAQWQFDANTPTPNLALLATASGSTQASTAQGFAKARDGVVDGFPNDPNREWASNGQRAGAFLKYTWSSARTVRFVVLSDRINPNDQVLSGTLSFSDGTSVAVGALPNDGSPLGVSFPARTVTWATFTVGSVSAATASVGLAEFEVH